MPTIDDAAEEFGLSCSTLYRAIDRHAIPRHQRLGDRKTYVSRAAIARIAGFREI